MAKKNENDHTAALPSYADGSGSAREPTLGELIVRSGGSFELLAGIDSFLRQLTTSPKVASEEENERRRRLRKGSRKRKRELLISAAASGTTSTPVGGKRTKTKTKARAKNESDDSVGSNVPKVAIPRRPTEVAVRNVTSSYIAEAPPAMPGLTASPPQPEPLPIHRHRSLPTSSGFFEEFAASATSDGVMSSPRGHSHFSSYSSFTSSPITATPAPLPACLDMSPSFSEPTVSPVDSVTLLTPPLPLTRAMSTTWLSSDLMPVSMSNSSSTATQPSLGEFLCPDIFSLPSTLPHSSVPPALSWVDRFFSSVEHGMSELVEPLNEPIVSPLPSSFSHQPSPLSTPTPWPAGSSNTWTNQYSPAAVPWMDCALQEPVYDAARCAHSPDLRAEPGSLPLTSSIAMDGPDALRRPGRPYAAVSRDWRRDESATLSLASPPVAQSVAYPAAAPFEPALPRLHS